jgi:hypothetical protein
MLAFLLSAVSSSFLRAQCANQIWQTTVKSKTITRFQSAVPAGMRPRFAAKLNDADWLVVYESKNPAENKTARDEGFVIMRNGRRLLNQTLMAIPAWSSFAKSMDEKDMPGFAVSVAQFCSGQDHAVAIAFGACCTTSSSILYFIAVANEDGYAITALPMVGGGKLELLAGSFLKLRLWDEMYETCTEKIESDACPRKFKISEYQFQNGHPVFVKQSVSSRRFSPGDFDKHRIVLLSADQ